MGPLCLTGGTGACDLRRGRGNLTLAGAAGRRPLVVAARHTGYLLRDSHEKGDNENNDAGRSEAIEGPYEGPSRRNAIGVTLTDGCVDVRRLEERADHQQKPNSAKDERNLILSPLPRCRSPFFRRLAHARSFRSTSRSAQNHHHSAAAARASTATTKAPTHLRSHAASDRFAICRDYR